MQGKRRHQSDCGAALRPRGGGRGAGAGDAAGAALDADRTVASTGAAAVAAYRARLVDAGERAITRDARARQADSPPRGAVCEGTPVGPTRDRQERDPAVARNRYECIAYERRFPLDELQGKARTGVFGTPYWLVADYTTGALTLCRMTPRGGEAARTLATAVVDPACRDPFRRQG